VLHGKHTGVCSTCGPKNPPCPWDWVGSSREFWDWVGNSRESYILSFQSLTISRTQPTWEIRISQTKQIPYFFNTVTNESRWDAPDTLSDEEIKQLPGAVYLLKNKGPQQVQSKDKDLQRVQARHLLVKHRDSRRPSSWKEVRFMPFLYSYWNTSSPVVQNNIIRSKEEAIAILQEYEAQLDGSEDTFAKLAEDHSDCSSHERGGSLGWFTRGAMQKPFEDATFALQVGQVSEIISTDSGVHLILRTGWGNLNCNMFCNYIVEQKNPLVFYNHCKCNPGPWSADGWSNEMTLDCSPHPKKWIMRRQKLPFRKYWSTQ